MKRSNQKTGREAYSTSLREAMHAHLPRRGLELIVEDQRVRWTPRILATAAILTTWHSANELREAFAAARDVVVDMYPTRKRPGKHLEGFLKALQNQSDDLLATIRPSLRADTQRLAGAAWRWKQWVLLGVDGSRINCPRTAANEAAFDCAGKEKIGPQQQLTTLFHLDTGLPWAWRRGDSRDSERRQLRDMLPEMPEKTLLLADAGFTGHELFGELRQRGHAFLIRAGRNVHLLEKLGWKVEKHQRLVYLWPKNRRDQPPLALRLITRVCKGKRMALLTNLTPEQLSDEEAEGLYRRRWELELLYRSLKQTLGKRTLRGAAPAAAKVELDWALTGLWLLGLMTIAAAGPMKVAAAGPKTVASAGSMTIAAAGLRQPWSTAGALKTVRVAMRRSRRRVGRRALPRLLRAAVRDSYVRTGVKTARDWPHKKRESPPGTPNVRTATPREITAAQAFEPPGQAA